MNLDNVFKQTKSAADVEKNLLMCFYEEIVSAKNKRLMDFVFVQEKTQENLDKLFEVWKLDENDAKTALLLAYVKKQNPNLKWPEEILPRLNGVMNFFRFANLGLLAHYTKICKKLNEHDIVPMIIKGGAMKHLRFDLPRHMGDIDVLILDNAKYEKSLEIARDMGYEAEQEEGAHSVDLHLPGSDAGILDIHRFLDLDIDYDKKYLSMLLDGARQTNVFGTQTLVPDNEVLFLIALCNLTKNLHRNCSISGVLFTIFDCQFLMSQEGFDINKVKKLAINFNALTPMFLAAKFVGMLLPGFLSEFVNDEDLHKKTYPYYEKVFFYKKFVYEAKMKCKKLRLKNALKSFEELKQWVKYKPKHFICKRIYKSPKLINLVLKIYRG